jgi:hypothetical protein
MQPTHVTSFSAEKAKPPGAAYNSTAAAMPPQQQQQQHNVSTATGHSSNSDTCKYSLTLSSMCLSRTMIASTTRYGRNDAE